MGKREKAASPTARGDRQTHFGTFDFCFGTFDSWVKPVLKPFILGNAHFLRLKAPKMHISIRISYIKGPRVNFFLRFCCFFVHFAKD